MMPSRDQTGVSHFHSSTIAGSASWMSFRTLVSFSPRQSPSSLMRAVMSWEALLSATIDAEASRPHEYERERGKEEEPLQLERPTSAARQQEEIGSVREEDGEQHVDDDDRRAEARVETENDEQRREHLADINAVGEHAWQSGAGHRLLQAVDAAEDLGDPVQQHQDAQREPENELACVVSHAMLLLACHYAR